MTTGGGLLAAEIAEQPQSLQRLLDHGLGAVREAAVAIERARPRFVLLAARGSSDHAALYAKYLFEVRLGLPCGLVSPSTLTTYAARPTLADVLWVTVSQSGTSPDLVSSTAVARAQGALTVAVTNAPHSPLAASAALHVDLLAGPERSVAATKSYTGQLLALHALVDTLAGGDGSAAQQVPALVAATLGRPEVLEQAERYRFAERILTTGRGYAYPTARETALKLMETSYLAAHAFSAADLLHGPLAMVDGGGPVVVFVPDGPGGRAVLPALDRLRERRADVLLVADDRVLAGPDAPRGSAAVPLPAAPTEALAPVLQILPMQRLAHAMAVARGHDPDTPRGLTKQTLTL